ncbi:MAG: hypothetical protein JNJ75_04545 [Cyclobacteriaceae bacterium]|nr:hypothetical protein [Cyclobacteriaceae bacterium]
MNKFVTQTADVIASLGTVIFVLLMTIIAMIFVGHGLYYQVFIRCMLPWQAEIASWVLSFGVETTVLVITCNVKYFGSRKLPLFFAICSGFIVLFFINAFDFSQSQLDLAIRWFMGLLVSGVNFVYSELFVKKFNDMQFTTNLLGELELIKHQSSESNQQLISTNAELTKAKADIDRLVDYIAELETFKKKEMDKVTCKFCKTIFPTIFHLNSHMRNCDVNPRKGEKLSVFEAVV